jgi:hypothetical protein
VRVSSNWTPIAPLTIQAFVDWADDRYSGRDGSNLGPRKGEARNYSVDAAYTFSDKWQANAWYNYNDARAEQASCEFQTAAAVCPPHIRRRGPQQERFRRRRRARQAGREARSRRRRELFGHQGTRISSRGSRPTTSAAAVPLPEVTTRLTRLSLFAKYALEKRSGLRFDYIFDRFSTNDWTWTNWVYADGTRLTRDPNQSVHFFGVSYYYRWQ